MPACLRPISLLLPLLSCSGEGGTAPEPPLPDGGGIEAVLSWSERVPTVATISWEAGAETTAWVEYGLDGALDRRTPTRTGPDPAIAVLGLKAGRSYAWRAVEEGPQGRVEGPVGTLDVVERPETLPRLVVEVDQGSEVGEGYLFLSTTSDLGEGDADSWAVVYDGEGDPVWWMHNPTGHLTVTPSLGATPGTVLWDRYDVRTSELWASGVRMTLDGTEQRELPLSEGHHAVIEPEPGVLAWIARDIRPNPTGPGFVTADRLYEAPADDIEHPREVVALYDALFGGTFETPCSHAAVPLAFGEDSPVFEWSHLNSLVYLPDRDAYLLHARWVDTVALVDRPSGEILWRLGGPQGEFSLPGGGDPYGSPEDSILGHAHVSDAWDGGLVAFDNGPHRTPQVSSIVELAWDEQTRTVEEVFRWTDPRGRFMGILGDARRLPGGHLLASWGTLGEITEVDRSGQIAWAASTEPSRWVSRLVFLPDLYGGG